MSESDLHTEIDELVMEIEKEIKQTAEFIDGLPEFEERTDRMKMLQRSH